MSISFGGISSGIDTATMINDLMRIEAIPQTLTKHKISDVQTRLKALQNLNTRIADLAEKTSKNGETDAWQLRAATASDESVTVAAANGTAPGSIDITVTQLAQAQTTLTDAMTGWDGGALTLTMQDEDGNAQTLTIEPGQSLDDLTAALNDAGLHATKVAAGTDPDGTQLYRLQITADQTGTAGAFTLTTSDGSDFGTTLRAAQDAHVELWAGTNAATTVTSSTNTFDSILSGVDITVSQVTSDPVTITVANDTDAVNAAASDLVDDLVAVFSYIDVNSRADFSTDAEGNPTTSLGVFTSDSTIRGVKQSLLNAATAPVNGRSPSEVGITITRDGTVEFDQERLAAALADDPEGTTATLGEIAARISTAATQASDKRDGTLTSTIQARESEIRSLNDQVADWDRRLALRRSTLERTWSQLEVSLGQLQAQQSWLSSQLAALPKANALGNNSH